MQRQVETVSAIRGEIFVLKFKFLDKFKNMLIKKTNLKDNSNYERTQNRYKRYESSFQKEYKISDFLATDRIELSQQVELKPRYVNPHRNWQLTELGKLLKCKENTNENEEHMSVDEEASFSKSPISNPHFTFKISTYNLLAPCLLQDNFYLYENIKKMYLSWNYRKKKIWDQIKNLNSDVCHFIHFFRKKLFLC